MGCLLFPLELLLEDCILDGWFALMEWIIPERFISRKFRLILKIIVRVFSVVLFLTVVLGVLAVISDDSYETQIGRYMIFIPLGISAFQILVGVIVRLLTKKKG